MRLRSSTLLLALLLLGAAEAGAGLTGLRVRRFTVDQGLSQSDVQAIVRDRQGFLWAGTHDGLNRFDGYTFAVHRNNPADSVSIADNFVWSLCAAGDGSLWIGTFAGGLNRYDPATGHFTRYRHDPRDPHSISWDNITTVIEGHAGGIWAGAWGGGLNYFDPRTGTFARFRHDPADGASIPGDRVYSLATTPSGKVWVGTWEGLALFDPATRAARRLPRVLPGGRTLTEIQALVPRGDTALWVGTQRNGLFHVDVASGHVTPVPLPSEKEGRKLLSVRALMEDDRGTLWIGTANDGIVLLDLRTGAMTVARNDQLDPRSIGYDAILSLHRQEDGLVWIGTSGAGMNLYNPRHERFELLSDRSPSGIPLSHNLARALLEDGKGRLWVGTSGGGITRLEPGRSGVRYFGSRAVGSSSLGSSYVHSLARDTQGRIWAGTAGDGLWRSDAAGERFARLPRGTGDPHGSASDLIGALLAARDGAVWVGYQGAGLERRDPETGKTQRWTRKSGDSTTLSGDYIFALFEGSGGEIWVGTWGQGLSRYDPRSGTFRRWLHAPSDPGSLPANTVNTVMEDRRGRIWVGTAGGGVAMLDLEAGRFRTIGEAQGLPNGVVYGILEDARGRLWVSTNYGMARVDPASGAVRAFFAADGLQGNEFNLGAALSGRDGRFYFGGVNGVTVFHPDSVRNDTATPDVVLTSFRVFDRPVHLDTLITLAREVVLEQPQNFFSFEFSALDFSSPEQVAYAYRMEGFDRDWVSTSGRRYASYTNLDPGRYLFRVRAANREGVWTSGGVAVRVTITPPFWSTWWFRALALLAAGGAVTMAARRRLSRDRRERQAREEFARGLLQSEEKERSRIAGELHDSLMQSLLIAKNRALLALRKPDDPATLRNGLDEIAGVMTGALDEVRRVAHNLRPYQLDRLGLTKALHSLATAAGESSEVRFTVDLDDLDSAFDRDGAILLYRVVQEAVNNVLKHSGAGEAHISAQRNAGEVILTVRDNGRGMAAAGKDPHELGFGMSGIAERIRMLGGTMSVESAAGKGTALHLRVPEGGSAKSISAR